MTYTELKQRCEANHISITSVCNEIGITMAGLRKGLINQSLSIKTVVSICEILCVDPNYFCGWRQTTGDVNFGNMQKGGKKNTMTVAPSEDMKKAVELLESQLKEKDAQLRTKDEQIAKLIEKL